MDPAKVDGEVASGDETEPLRSSGDETEPLRSRPARNFSYVNETLAAFRDVGASHAAEASSTATARALVRRIAFTPPSLSAAGAAGTTGSGDECEAGKAECDGDPLTVCEQALNLVTSCGDCNTTCKSTNASVVCDPIELECKITDCTSGFGSCDDNPAHGCETNLVSNAQHCGACGRDCTALNTTCAVDHCDKTPLQQNLPALGAKTWAFGPSGMYHAAGYNYALRHMPLDGAAPAVVWAPVNKTVGTESLLITPTEVIWAERGSAAFTSPVLKKAVGVQDRQVAISSSSGEPSARELWRG